MGNTPGVLISNASINLIDENDQIIEDEKIVENLEKKIFTDFAPSFYDIYKDQKLLQKLREEYESQKKYQYLNANEEALKYLNRNKKN